MTQRLITGATGLVGGAIVLELLERTGDELFCLVRGDSAGEAGRRLHATLTEMARGYGNAGLADEVVRRVHAIVGDITWPGCTRASIPRLDEVWHCAASLRYEDERREEIEEHNVRGTANVLALARQAGAGTINYVSTAYVAGNSAGAIREASAADPAVCNNAYEASKVAAERIVLGAQPELRVRILRPSIIIGHSSTHYAPNFTGMYGFARQLMQFRRTVSRRLGTFLAHSRVRLLAEPDIECNLIPVDAVSRNAVTIGLSGSAETFYHLTNAAPPTVGTAAGVIFRLLGLREPLWVTSRDGFTALDGALDAGMTFYRSYLRNGKTFGRANTDAVCGAAASAYPLPADEIAAYVEFFFRKRGWAAGKNVTSRVVHESVA